MNNRSKVTYLACFCCEKVKINWRITKFKVIDINESSETSTANHTSKYALKTREVKRFSNFLLEWSWAHILFIASKCSKKWCMNDFWKVHCENYHNFSFQKNLNEIRTLSVYRMRAFFIVITLNQNKLCCCYCCHSLLFFAPLCYSVGERFNRISFRKLHTCSLYILYAQRRRNVTQTKYNLDQKVLQ